MIGVKMDKFFFRKNELGILDENNVWHLFNLRFTNARNKFIRVKNVCVINLYKVYDHRYDIYCFFYKNYYLYYQECILSKKELFNVIQKVLEENL